MKKQLRRIYPVLTPALICAASLQTFATEAAPALVPIAARNAHPAADITVTGTILDNAGQPLPGVTVLQKGTTNGVSTGVDGKFTLTVPDDATLVLSFVGYATQEVAVGGRTTLTATMLPSSTGLAEAVVIGYGTQRREDVTSAVSSVKAENFVKGNTRDAGQLLQGKVAGLSVGSPSGDPLGGAQIVLRGNSSVINSRRQPLVIIDGVPGDLRTVAPEDIAQIDVLKDGSAAAIYGTLGTDGVILITTKRPSQGTRLSYSGYLSTERVRKYLPVLTADEYRAQIASGVLAAAKDANGNPANDFGADTDWQKASQRNPFTNVHNLTLTSGNNTTTILANVNYRNVQGIYLNSDNQAIVGRFNIVHNMFNNRLKLDLNWNGTYQKYSTTFNNVGFNPNVSLNGGVGAQAAGGSFNTDVNRLDIVANPTLPVTSIIPGQRWAQLYDYNPNALVLYYNPVSVLNEGNGQNANQRQRVYGNITVTPIDNLRLNALLSSETFSEDRGYDESFQHPASYVVKRQGFASRGSETAHDRLLELTAQYSHNFGEHSLTGLVGYTYRSIDATGFYTSNYNFPTDQFGYNNIGAGTGVTTVGFAPTNPLGSSKSSANLISFLGRVNYNFGDRYLASASLRYEESSLFLGSNKVWGAFPAVSVGWRIIKENFLRNATYLSELKLRAGYGRTGSLPGGPYLGQYTLGYGAVNDSYYYNGAFVQTFGAIRNQNSDFTWEKKGEFNVGLDFGFFKGRINGSVDVYQRKVTDLLYNYPVPTPPNPVGTTLANVGSLRNQGIEVTLNLVPVQTEKFEWTTTLLGSTNASKLLSLNSDKYSITQDYFDTGDLPNPIAGSEKTHRVQVGQPLGQLFGYEVAGIDPSGLWLYKGANDVIKRSDDRTLNNNDKRVLGNGLPKYYAGWNNSFRFGNLDLNIVMRGAFGFQIANLQRVIYGTAVQRNQNAFKEAFDVIDGVSRLKNVPAFNSYYVENGDYWKLDNITLGYNIGGGKSKYFRSARVYVSTLNTLTITKYKGQDPDVDRLGLSPGVDYLGKYPSTRAYTVGLNLNF